MDHSSIVAPLLSDPSVAQASCDVALVVVERLLESLTQQQELQKMFWTILGNIRLSCFMI